MASFIFLTGSIHQDKANKISLTQFGLLKLQIWILQALYVFLENNKTKSSADKWAPVKLTPLVIHTEQRRCFDQS